MNGVNFVYLLAALQAGAGNAYEGRRKHHSKEGQGKQP